MCNIKNCQLKCQHFAIHASNTELMLQPYSHSPDREDGNPYLLDVRNIYWWRVMDIAVYFNSLTAIRVLAGTTNSRPVGFYSRNSTKSTVNPNTTIHNHYHHGGAVRPSFGMGSMDPPDHTRRPSSEGVGRGDGGKRII